MCVWCGAGLCGDYLYCSPRHSLLLHRLLDVLLPSGRRQTSPAMISVRCMRAQSLCPWLAVMSECMMICLGRWTDTVHMCSYNMLKAYAVLPLAKTCCSACVACPPCMLSIGVCCSCRQILLVSVVQLAHPHLLHLLW